MNADRKSLFESLGDWFRNLFVFPPANDTAASKDPDFDGWIANDPMITFNPASRYGDDATGFLAGGERENPELAKNDD